MRRSARFGRTRPAGRLASRAVRLVAVAACLAPAPAQSQQDAIDAFARQIAADVEADGVGGITAAAFRGDQVLWAQGFGWADPEGGVPAGVRTIYRTGSISKSITAVLMADLIEDGVIGLDQEVRTVLPEAEGFADAPEGAAPITFRQLASHTAGLIREPRLQGAAAGPIEDWGHKVLASIPHTSYYALPGASYQYSNIGFGVLGYALQRAAGQSFMELVEERMFEPLGMTSSTFIIGPELSRRLAVGHANSRNGDVNLEAPAREHAGRGYKVPNGGVYATVGDLATFAAAVMGRTEHELLDPETRAEVMRVQTPEDPSSGYGLGFTIRSVELPDGRSIRLVGHGGSVAGYNMFLVFEPDSGLGVAMGRNYNVGETNLGGAASELLMQLVSVDPEWTRSP